MNVLNAEGEQYMLLKDELWKQDLLLKLAGSSDLKSGGSEARIRNGNAVHCSQGKGYDTEQNAPESLDANSKLSVVIGFCI